MNKLIIDRFTWNVGQSLGASRLLNTRGGRCCLGFLGKACGLPDRDAMVTLPSNCNSGVSWPSKLFTKFVLNSQSIFVEKLFAHINDKLDIDNDVREAWIAEGFKTLLDYEVEFVGEYPEQ